MIRIASSVRRESRGSHYRSDCPETDPDSLYNIVIELEGDGTPVWDKRPVKFTRRLPEDLLGDTAIPTTPPKMEARTEA